jgi:hypothetical protein
VDCNNRIQKTSDNVVTRTFFPGYYEEAVNGSTTTLIKHSSFLNLLVNRLTVATMIQPTREVVWMNR